MKNFEDAFSDQQMALDRTVEAGLALQQFRSRHGDQPWTAELGQGLQVLLDEMTQATRALDEINQVVSMRHREKLALGGSPPGI
ncbi:hypothetical protein HNR46_002057 [Haloferula luteola]|uniref:Uncharacterized protein n=1 Tax=Haloferula luteola TaxID=595692 RepID=A0A840VAV7_9BACT|nr:hypothetical protein [Haloferula luteola]MBB5351818.1 hypothetical protein [Haloferula luteola]